MTPLTQPLGIFPFPAGLLLLPAGCSDDLVQTLADGRLPQTWPSELAALQSAHAADPQAALAALTGDDPVSRWNRWVLDPGREEANAVREALPPELADLVGIVAYMTGESDEVPQTGSAAAPGVRALGASARAADALQHGRPDEALRLLSAAADDAEASLPVLAAVLRANAGTIAQEQGLDPVAARALLTQAAQTLADTDLDLTRAEVHHQLGSMAHEESAARGEPLRLAMHHYHTALQLVTQHSAPYLWATTQLNLATAYLSSPMTGASDQLRHGIATQSLRSCLEVLTADEYPALWSTATLNLANALVYTPSTHQGDNLVEAVELYEAVLEARPRERDPLGRARVLANQGNVLAHLGMFEPAKAKLAEARFLFEEQLDHDGAMAVRSVLDEIVKATLGGGDDVDSQSRDAREMAQLSRMTVPPAGMAGAAVQVPPRPKVTVLSRESS